MLEGGAYREILDGNQPASDLPDYLQTALEALYPDTDINDLTTDQLTAGIYNYYVRTYVLEPAGVTGGDTKQPPGNSTVLVYDFPAQDEEGEPIPGIDTEDQTPNAGGRGWNLSAYELQQFLTAAPVRRRPALAGDPRGHARGRTRLVGGRHAVRADARAQRCELPQRRRRRRRRFLGNRVNTRITNFANGVNASLVINSQLGDGLPGTETIVYDAYTAAWPVLVVEGDSGDNTFILRQRGGREPPHGTGGGRRGDMLSQDALQSLTLRGLGGNDTFQIEILPESAELILEGGTEADTFVVDANGIGGIHGSIAIDGGTDEDDLAVSGINDGSEPPTPTSSPATPSTGSIMTRRSPTAPSRPSC